ncbi:MAG: tetratricopeptide repeat protein [Deltaproteobacteria bacterium]|nr:tetratricopeptide repeat protein [Deltaproteobacteria bacterium]
MTDHRDLKHIIRKRQAKTGESYVAARVHVLRERARLSATPSPAIAEIVPVPELPWTVEAVVLKLNRQSARLRILGDDSQVTFRSGDLWEVVPGQIVTLDIARRWSWHLDPYASGRVRDARIDIPRLGLVPLPLAGGESVDVAAEYEAPRPRDPWMPLWRRLTSRPRAAFEFDGIAWGALPGFEGEDNPTCRAAELVEEGEDDAAYRLLMEALLLDLRCIDAHAHLGNMEFERRPERAALHYRIGLGIGELSLPEGFDGILPWSMIFNRPFLRCLHGLGLCLWRTGEAKDAMKVFERILLLNPNDNQGARFCRQDVRAGRTWEEAQDRDQAAER